MAIQTPTRPEQNTKRRPDAATARRLTLRKALHKRISLIAVGICMCVVLVAALVAGSLYLKQQIPEDHGNILPNVYVGNVNIGGMTTEDARLAIQLAVIPVLTQEDMVVQLPNDTLRISPQDARISLDVEQLIATAYSYGRSGSVWGQAKRWAQAEKTSYHIALLPYMQFDSSYISDAVSAFCENYSTALVEPSVVLQGERPIYGTLSPTHQTLVLTMGSPESILSPDAVYDRILDGYSMLDMEVQYEAPISVEPQQPSAQAIFDQYCQLPQDATIDNNTFAITPEVYGYGFHVESLQQQIDQADYGQVIQITLDFLLPDITVNALNTNLFTDTLSSYVSKTNDGTNNNRDANLRVACEAINGYVIKVGERFDLDDILGPRTKNKGYREAPLYSGSTTSAIGGGINQVASTLYYCAMQAGLTVNERHAHRYAVSYTPLGTDASITYGIESLVFTNNTSAPIRIIATADKGTVSITFLGTDDRDYTTKVETVVKETFAPNTVYQHMVPENVYGYVDGQVIQTSQTGYRIEVYVCKYDKATGRLIERKLLEEARYDARDQIVVKEIEGDEEDIA